MQTLFTADIGRQAIVWRGVWAAHEEMSGTHSCWIQLGRFYLQKKTRSTIEINATNVAARALYTKGIESFSRGGIHTHAMCMGPYPSSVSADNWLWVADIARQGVESVNNPPSPTNTP